MNYIQHQNAFFERISHDERIGCTHVSLYMALFQYWNASRFQEYISITRSEIMKISKLKSASTHHKVLRQLADWGYIEYRPSFSPLKGSTIRVIPLTVHRKTNRNLPLSEKEHGRYLPPDGGGGVQDTINNINNIETGKGDTPPSEKIIDGSGDGGGTGVPQSHEEVKRFFVAQKSTEQEANKFFYHYKSNGWKVGLSPMVNWQAAALKWIVGEGVDKGKLFKSGDSSSNSKNYGEPL